MEFRLPMNENPFLVKCITVYRFRKIPTSLSKTEFGPNNFDWSKGQFIDYNNYVTCASDDIVSLFFE